MFDWPGMQRFEAVRCELTNPGLFVKTAMGKNLEYVDASENPFNKIESDSHLTMARDLLKHSPKLETLICGCATIKGNVVKAKIHSLESASLKHLDLSGIFQE